MLWAARGAKVRTIGDFCADVGADAVFLGGGVEAGGAVDAVAVEQGDGGEVELDGGADEGLGLRGAFEKAEGAGGVELDVGVQS